MAEKKVVAKIAAEKKPVACRPSVPCCSQGGAIYGLGWIGAVIYYISTATGFWMGVLGLLKSIIWPVFLVYGLLKFIGA